MQYVWWNLKCLVENNEMLIPLATVGKCLYDCVVVEDQINYCNASTG